ncbi:MAG: hypothetical protein OIF48_14835 [Silicimonas sp.]|nr:hypothetical protein [Silicimonas sp.]
MRYLLPLLLLAACGYTPPEASSLIGFGPYPGPGDVCQKIAENDLSNPYLDDTQQLIGCPTHERGAIADRLRDGGELLDRIGDWQLIAMPLR